MANIPSQITYVKLKDNVTGELSTKIPIMIDFENGNFQNAVQDILNEIVAPISESEIKTLFSKKEV